MHLAATSAAGSSSARVPCAATCAAYRTAASHRSAASVSAASAAAASSMQTVAGAAITVTITTIGPATSTAASPVTTGANAASMARTITHMACCAAAWCTAMAPGMAIAAAALECVTHVASSHVYIWQWGRNRQRFCEGLSTSAATTLDELEERDSCPVFMVWHKLVDCDTVQLARSLEDLPFWPCEERCYV